MNLLQNEAPPILGNPFFHRGPIRDRRYFFGRKAETRRALEMLRKCQCVSIVGPRRIGKTSLLFHFCDPEVQKKHGLGEEYLFVYIDCQGLGDLDRQQFYHWLWKETKRALAERGKAVDWAESISVSSGLREAIVAIQEKGYKPAFLFDEFDTIAQSLSLDQNLFRDLRSLVPTVIYTTASQDSLYDLTHIDKSALSSPFFNPFIEIYLGFLSPKEAEAMVGRLLRMAEREDLFTEKDLVFVLEVGGYHPFFLQLACYYLFEQKLEQKDLTTTDYEIVRQCYAEDAERHFHYTWKNLDAREREAVRLVCEGMVSEIDYEQKRRLERECILYKVVP